MDLLSGDDRRLSGVVREMLKPPPSAKAPGDFLSDHHTDFTPG